ncbi:MAG: hypothetical protein EOP04_02460 [Proteobacteria bacterium]|nr:MAG: hypothetical protein EOP04_02460 [Pseudomonadota bacterium]
MHATVGADESMYLFAVQNMSGAAGRLPRSRWTLFFYCSPWHCCCSEANGAIHQNNREIFRLVSGHLSSTLYVCVLSAKKQNTGCGDLFDRIRTAGKPAKHAFIAVYNELLKLAFAIATKGTTYQADFKAS